MDAQIGDEPTQVDVGALYYEYGGKIEDGARHVLEGNDADTFDAVQTVVLKLQDMHHRGVLTPRQDWAPYLWRAGRNAALDIITTQQKLGTWTVPLDSAVDDGLADRVHDRTDGFDPVADRVVLRHDVRRLWAAMDQLGLDARGRRVVTGYWVDDLTDADLGRELGITGQRVGVIRRDIQDKLAHALQGGEHT